MFFLIINLGNFDGFYTYFSSNGFTEASTTLNWDHLAQIAIEKNLIFIPCVGPGYNDERSILFYLSFFFFFVKFFFF